MPKLDGMARFLRASLLLTALGVAAPVLTCSSAAAANIGGAAPASSVAVVSSANGGAGAGSQPASALTTTPPATATPPKGAAAPGAKPARVSTSKTAGGALPGHKPHRAVVPSKPKTPRAQGTPAAPTIQTVPGVFPVNGPFTFGGDDARFGTPRNGHTHQGQDVVASSATPIVAPVAGTILWKANQPGGAGIYLILHTDTRDYAFMHIKRGTVQVKIGDAVAPGQQLAQVGATGDATGPHLHFEIWVGGWYVAGGMPVDPLPQLQRWAGLPATP